MSVENTSGETLKTPDIRLFRQHLNSVRGRAKKSNIPFDLDAEYLQSIWTGVCPAFGTDLRPPTYGSHHDPYITASLDKNVPSLGYVKGNVTWVSKKANTIKNDATPEELMEVALWVKSLNLPNYD